MQVNEMVTSLREDREAAGKRDKLRSWKLHNWGRFQPLIVWAGKKTVRAADQHPLLAESRISNNGARTAE
jgi:hypothetical protein